MGQCFEDAISVKLILVNGTFSCLYIAFLILALVYSGRIYSIGKYGSIYISMILIAAEIIKCCYKKKFSVQRTETTAKLNILNSAFLLLATVFAFYAIPVLYGGPFFEKFEETLMFSLLVSALTIVPALVHLGYKRTILLCTNLINLDTSSTTSLVIMRNIQGTILGAWSSAVVIPLDWDRPWQQWPIPCCTGALLGYASGNLISMFLACRSVKKYRK